MPYLKKSSKPKRRVAVRRVAKKPRSAPRSVPLSVKKYIKSTISRSSETKFLAPVANNNVTIAPYDTTSQLCTLINLTTALSCNQGSGQGDRLGDEITVKNMSFKGYISYEIGATPLSSSPVFIKMVLGRLRSTLSQPTSFATLFQSGNSISAPQNLPTDMFRHFNKDAWTILQTRMFKLGYSGNSGTTITGASPNNDFSLCQMFNISLNKHVNKLKYSDGGTVPTNSGLFVWFLMCDATGNSLTTNPPAPQINYDIEVAFKDA